MANLRSAILIGEFLVGADFAGADLHGANVEGAVLYGADLHNTDLYRANLSGANLESTMLIRTNLCGVTLPGQNSGSMSRFIIADLTSSLIVGGSADLRAWKLKYSGRPAASVLALQPHLPFRAIDNQAPKDSYLGEIQKCLLNGVAFSGRWLQTNERQNLHQLPSR